MLHETADGVDPCDIGNLTHLWANDPVLDRTQVGQPLFRRRQPLSLRSKIAAVSLPARLPGPRARSPAPVEMREVDRPHQHFAKAGRHRSDLWIHPGRQCARRLRQALTYLLAGEIEIGIVGEDHRDLRKPVARDRAGFNKAGHARHGSFNGIADLAFHFRRPERGRDGVDLHLPVGNVGHRIDRQLDKLGGAINSGECGQEDHQHPSLDGEGEDFFNHGSSSQ